MASIELVRSFQNAEFTPAYTFLHALPDGLSAEVLTQIYGEEDWSATIRKVEEDDEEEEPGGPLPDRERMAGIT